SKERWQQAQAAGEVFDTEYRLRRSDGAYRWFIGRNVPMRDAEDRLSGWFGTATDIEDLKLAEAATRASEEQFRRAIEEAPIPVIMHTEDGQVLQISKTWTELTGYTVADIPTVEALLSGAYGFQSDQLREHMALLFSGDMRRLNVDFDVTTIAGERRRWSFSASAPGTLHDGRRFVVGMALDITDRERAESALKVAFGETEQARAGSEAAGKAKDHFLAVLSHELRTPLTPILLAVDILTMSGEYSAKSRETLEMIRRNVQLEASLIEDLLDVTRIGRGKFEITRVPVDVHEVIAAAISVTEGDLATRRQSLTVELEAGEHRVSGDFSRLQQVVWNLIKNASKFSPDASVIRVCTRNDEAGEIVIEVSDDGIGIEPAMMSRIFDAFSQADAAVTRRFGGLGLGLAIAKATVESHAGRIHAESAGLGTGATFTVTLPLGA
ncbi:MAG TPA: PAS domain-containing sensor histidine kinase, partial [Gemmatimonadaceae bacterium]|nr:PAS domain-containing sensor histidine kinase [Gemmatimonadaceae bacterium]